MREFLVKLKPVSPFHIGEPGIGVEKSLNWLPSDLIFSAFCHAYYALYGEKELEELLQAFLSSPPFLISSAFPFYEETLFLPPPLWGGEKWRELRKEQFITLTMFRNWIEGIDGEVEEIEREKLPRSELIPGVVLDRLTLASQIYHRGILYFPEGGGFFLLIRLYEETLREKLEKTIAFLGEMGIGGERSIGFGAYKLLSFEEKSLFPLPKDSSHILTLSLVVPAPEEFSSLSSSYYKLVRRGGWSFSPSDKISGRRKEIWMLCEGSVFPKAIKGQLLDLTPDGFPHKVYRYALTFPVGVILNA